VNIEFGGISSGLRSLRQSAVLGVWVAHIPGEPSNSSSDILGPALRGAQANPKSNDRVLVMREHRVWRDIVRTVIAAAIGGVIGVWVAHFPGKPSNSSTWLYPSTFGLFTVVQVGLTSRFWRGLAFRRSSKTIHLLSSASAGSFVLVFVAVLCLALVVPIELTNNGSHLVPTFIWLATSISVLSVISRWAIRLWNHRVDLQREISAFVLSLNVLTALVFGLLTVVGWETVTGNLDNFSVALAQTSIIAATVMSVPAGIWIVFVAHQP
jgi:hypothetical protein